MCMFEIFLQSRQLVDQVAPAARVAGAVIEGIAVGKFRPETSETIPVTAVGFDDEVECGKGSFRCAVAMTSLLRSGFRRGSRGGG